MNFSDVALRLQVSGYAIEYFMRIHGMPKITTTAAVPTSPSSSKVVVGSKTTAAKQS